MSEKKSLKDVELKLIAELMRNSRRSDRELARTVGVSQPTVSRLVRKLEKEGYIKEYTMIPDFNKLGLGLLSITFAKRPKDVSREELARIEKEGTEIAKKQGIRTIMALRGIGLGYDVAIIALHPDYASYTEVVRAVQGFPHSDVSSIQSFLISLEDKVQYRPITFSHLATYLSELAEKRGEEE